MGNQMGGFMTVFGESAGSGIDEKGSVKRILGDKNSFVLLTPVVTSKGFENVDTGLGTGDDRIDAGGEDGMFDASNSQYVESPSQR